MRKTHKVTINGEEFSARRGDVLLDAALLAGVEIPYDCRAGQCGTCAVSLLEGEVYGGASGEGATVLACQCRIISDVRLVVEDVPPVTAISGRITRLMPLAADIVEVWIEPSRPVRYLPGQYFRVRFRGFPERCYSPTVPLDRPGDGWSIRLHIRRLPDGLVSSSIGRYIRKGHRVTLSGPFGSAFFRESLANRLVLVSTGTGFAPIWSIANAAINENPDREIVIVAGARTIESLYMVRGLRRLAYYPNVKIIPVASTPQNITRVVRLGRTTDYLPELSPEDIVYVCGAPPMVEDVKEIARKAGAVCYADPFVAQGNGEDSLLSRAMSWILGSPPAASTSRTLLPPPRPARKAKPILISIPGDRPAPTMDAVIPINSARFRASR